MNRKFTLSAFLILICITHSVVANSGFIKLLYGLTPLRVEEGKNKSAIVLTETFYGYHPIYYLQETDSLGNILQLVDLSSIQDVSFQNSVDLVLNAQKEIFIISHFKSGSGAVTQKISKIENGAIVFTKDISNSDTLRPLPLRSYTQTDDNGIMQLLSNTHSTQYVLQKLNNTGDIVFTKNIPASSFNMGIDTLRLFNLRHELRISKQSGNYYITGIGLNAAQNKYEIFQAIYHSTTDNFSFNKYALPELQVNASLQPILFEEKLLSTGAMRAAVLHYDTSLALNTYYVEDLNIQTGMKNLHYSFQDSSNNANFPQRLKFDESGALYFLKPNTFIKRFPTGSIKWIRVLFPDRVASDIPINQDFIFMRSFSSVSDSSFYIVGKGGRALYNVFCLCVGVLMKTDKEGIVFKRQISGNIYSDENNTCAFEQEHGIRNVLVTAYNNNATYYAMTDSLGNYKMPVENGAYTVKVILPDSLYWQACSPSLQINTLTDTTKVDFALQKNTACPLLQTDISIPYLRRCFENTYTIHFCNYGTATAENAYIKVSFPQEMEVRNTSIPWSSTSNNTFTFALGNLQEQSCGEFHITAYLSCGDSTILGETHCVEAHIFPDSLCLLPDARWDGSIITVAGECEGDSVRFKISNIGTGNMRDPNVSYVLEGDFLRVAPLYFQLNAGQSQTFTYPADGSTQTFVAQQSAYYPFGGYAVASVDGCNGFSPGYVTHFSQESNSPFTAINCTQNIGSYDPNFKAALPVGIDSLHFITSTTNLQYILHFQNTGTDTAFNIVVEDTLSPFLDVSCFRVGGSSHRCTYTIEQSGLLKIIFANIYLPDSGRNEAASQGYFSFSINPKSTLSDYTVIKNKATIYFDFNEGVSTDAVMHTINNNLYRFVPDAIWNTKNTTSVSAYPNPFTESIKISVKDINYSQKLLYLSLNDISGRLVFKTSFKPDEEIKLQALENSVYIFTISYQEKIISTGKLIKQ